MGNVPAKESRSRSSSTSSTVSGIPSSGSYTNLSSTSRSPPQQQQARQQQRRNTISYNLTTNHKRSASAELRRYKRHQEREMAQETHYMQLIVKYDENVDGGYLAPYGTYKSNLDYNCDIVRKLIIDGRMSPFLTPLQDFDESWTDDELCIILSQLPLHALEPGFSDEEEEDDLDDHKIHKSANFYKRQESKEKLKALIERVKDLQALEEQRYLEERKTSKDYPSRDLLLRLYREPAECPICFLYYPSHLNVSRCCLQPICTECFVQIKRLDPHPPHDEQQSNEANKNELPQTLISEPASCPYCAMPDFGITYDPPSDIRTGIGGTKPGDYKLRKSLDVVNDQDIEEESATNNNPSSPSKKNNNSPPVTPRPKTRKRRGSIAANAPGVITVDMIRPDWETNLLSARNRLARKAAAASAIHASNLLILDSNSTVNNSSGNGDNSDMYRRLAAGRRRANTSGSPSQGDGTSLRSIEENMLAEALRLSIIDEEERKKKQAEEEEKNKKKKKKLDQEQQQKVST